MTFEIAVKFLPALGQDLSDQKDLSCLIHLK